MAKLSDSAPAVQNVATAGVAGYLGGYLIEIYTHWRRSRRAPNIHILSGGTASDTLPEQPIVTGAMGKIGKERQCQSSPGSYWG